MTALTLALTAPLTTGAETNNTLLLFGDSIVAGGYGNLVVPLIEARYPGITHENRGIGATALTDTTYPPKTHNPGNGVNRYVKDVIERRPRIFVMEYGTNDNYFWILHGKPEQGLQEFAATYRKVIGEINAALPDTLIVLQTIASSTYPQHDYEDWTAAANTIIYDIAIDAGLVVADMNRELNHDFSGFPDGIHPNPAGQQQMAAILAKAILAGKPQSAADWGFVCKGPMVHRIQGYSFQAPDIRFDPKARFGDFVEVRQVTAKGLLLRAPCPVSVRTPAFFPPQAPVSLRLTSAGKATPLTITADAQGAIAFSVGTQAAAPVEIEIAYETAPRAAAGAAPPVQAPSVRTVWLRVPDVKGSYTIPYIQSSPDLEIRTAFAEPAVVKARVTLLRSGRPSGAEVETTPAAPTARFPSLAPAEYAVRITGLDADGAVVSQDRHERLAIGTVIAALGDSITEGYHSQWFWRDNLDLTPDAFPPEAVSKDGRNYPQYTPTTSYHRPEVNTFASWMPHLNDLLTEKWQRPVFIANEGWGGFTTANYLSLMQDPGWQERMRLLKPTVWLIHLGVNDERHAVPAETVAANLAAMVEILLKDYAAEPARIYLSRPCYDYAAGAAPILETYIREIDALIAAKGLQPGPDFFKAYAVEKETYYGTDPVHPNLAGMTLMAKLWAEALTR